MEIIIQKKSDISVEKIQEEINHLLDFQSCFNNYETQKMFFPNLCEYFLKDQLKENHYELYF